MLPSFLHRLHTPSFPTIAVAMLFVTGITLFRVGSGVVASLSSFPDVPGDHPYRIAIEYMRSIGLIQGYPDGTFRPQAFVTRAEMVKLVMGDIPEHDRLECVRQMGGVALFTDVPDATVWYGSYLCMAKRLGIVSGYVDGSFQPARNVSAAEMLKIVANTYNITPTIAVSTPPWYAPFVYAMNERALVPPSILSADQLTDRGELAEVLYRIFRWKGRVADAPSGPTSAPAQEVMRVPEPLRPTFAASSAAAESPVVQQPVAPQPTGSTASSAAASSAAPPPASTSSVSNCAQWSGNGNLRADGKGDPVPPSPERVVEGLSQTEDASVVTQMPSMSYDGSTIGVASTGAYFFYTSDDLQLIVGGGAGGTTSWVGNGTSYVCISDNGDKAQGMINNEVRSMNLRPNARYNVLNGGGTVIGTAMACSLSGRYVAVTGAPGAWLFDTQANALSNFGFDKPYQYFPLFVSDDGRILYRHWTDAGSVYTIYNPGTHAFSDAQPPTFGSEVYSNNLRFVVGWDLTTRPGFSAGTQSKMNPYILDRNTGAKTYPLACTPYEPYGGNITQLSADGRYALITISYWSEGGSYRGKVLRYDTQDKTFVELKLPANNPGRTALSGDGHTFATLLDEDPLVLQSGNLD